MDDLSTAVSDVTYTVSDQLTEQVNTIINKVQTEEDGKSGKEAEGSSDEVQKERKLKRQETEADADGEGRRSRKSKKNSMWTIEIDEAEIQREKERQEEARRAEEEEWEWCYAPSKGWYRKRKDPNQPSQTSDNQTGNNEQSKEVDSGTSEESTSLSGKHKKEGDHLNENANGMQTSNSQEEQDSEEMSGDPDTSTSNIDRNGEHHSVEENEKTEEEEDKATHEEGKTQKKNGKSKAKKDKDCKGETVCWTCCAVLCSSDGVVLSLCFLIVPLNLTRFYPSTNGLCLTDKSFSLFLISTVLQNLASIPIKHTRIS